MEPVEPLPLKGKTDPVAAYRLLRVLEGAPSFEVIANPAPGQTGVAEDSNAPYVADFLATAEGLHLNMAFARIHDPKIRKRIVDLVSSLAGEEPAPGERENQNPDEDTTR